MKTNNKNNNFVQNDIYIKTKNSTNKFQSYNCCLVDRIWLNNYIDYNNQIKNKNKYKLCKKNDIKKPSKILILNSLEDIKNYIHNNKYFEIVEDDYIISINQCFKKNVKIIMKETYFGFNKVIIKFNDGANINYLLYMVKENEYYVFVINDNKLIKKLFNEKYENIFGKKSKFKNINFILLNNINNINYTQNYTNSFNNTNNINNSYHNINYNIINNNSLTHTIEEEKDISKDNNKVKFNQNNISNNIKSMILKKVMIIILKII